MFAGFIFEDYRMFLKKLEKNEIDAYRKYGEYTCIDMNDYYIFVSNSLDANDERLDFYISHIKQEIENLIKVLG